jgi:heme exporter protein D
MNGDYVWQDLGITDAEVRVLIQHHTDAARKLEQQAQKRKERASELESAITVRIITASGARAS